MGELTLSVLQLASLIPQAGPRGRDGHSAISKATASGPSKLVRHLIASRKRVGASFSLWLKKGPPTPREQAWLEVLLIPT